MSKPFDVPAAICRLEQIVSALEARERARDALLDTLAEIEVNEHASVDLMNALTRFRRERMADVSVLAARDMRRLEAENADLKVSVIAFGGPWMAEYARDHGLPDRHLFAEHYDILARAGARMDDFVRNAPAPAAEPGDE